MAYAAVISLKHTIERLKNPQITESAHQELDSLRYVLTRLDGSSVNRSKINGFDAKIREEACKLEDKLESYILHHHSLPPSHSLCHEIDLFFNSSQTWRDEYSREIDYPSPAEEDDDDVSPVHDFGGNHKSTMVGLSDQFENISKELLDLQSERKIVSLFGMAGIGKTHLARKIYERPTNVRHFNSIVWVRVGPKCQIENVLLDILAQVNPTNVYTKGERTSLGECLYQSLYGRRYFIVLDDIWNTGIWNHLLRFFPENKKGSRILLTTRLEKLVDPTTCKVHKVPFLSKEESWSLLWQNVFVGEESFPPQLEKAGRKIAENCEGLPLLILAVAEILRGLDKTEKFWNEVAEKKTTTFKDAYEKISKVLSSSYEYLPQYLKPCFLYMGVFPQDFEIPTVKLINLLSVEDFLEPNHSKTLQVIAMECLEQLVSQSLVIVCKHNSNSIIKSSKLHSAYWHLCVKEAGKIRFSHALSTSIDASKDLLRGQRRLSVQNNILFGIKEVHNFMADTSTTARSLLCTGEDHKYPVPICLNLMLLKVLDALAIRFYEFPNDVLKLLQLRYLAFTQNGNLPCSISHLQNLQCLIVRQYHNIKFMNKSTTYFPREIWDLQELRHLWIMGSIHLPDPINHTKLPKLSTLHVNADSCTNDVFRSTTNLKKLGIKVELKPDGAETISCLEHIGEVHELESLKCVVMNPRLRSKVVAPPDHLSNLPRGLKKLSLNGLGYSWEYMSAIGLLPNLQVLKLRCSAFQGAEWETEVGEFQCLEFLMLEDIDLVHWTARDEKCFPRLQRLMISHCYKMRKIPWQIGEIATLKTIEIVDCSPSLEAYAREIQEELNYSGNDYLQFLIHSKF